MNLQIDEYLVSKYEWTPTTRDTARKLLGSWDQWLDSRDLEAVGISDFEAWVEEKGWSNSMRFNLLWAVTGYLKWAGIEHPLLRHKVRRRLPPPGDYLTQEDVVKLLGQCNTFKPIGAGYFVGLSAQGARDFAVVAFLWDTWCRAQELCNVQLKHLDLEKQEVVFRVKGGAFKKATFSARTKAALEIWLIARNEIARPTTRTLFVSTTTGEALSYGGLSRLLRRLGEKAGVSVTAHAFRRGAARHWANEGGNGDRQGMARGRWNSFSSYSRYTRSVSR